MNINNLKWIDNLKTIDWNELSNLYKIAPLGDKPADMLKIAFNNSAFTYFVYANKKLIGVGRALVDSVDSAYLCDIAINPEYQGYRAWKSYYSKTTR